MAELVDVSQAAMARVRRRLIPFLFLLYVVAYLDRVNVGFAALDMNRDLGFSAAVYGLGSGIFFVSYTLLEVPSNLMLARVGAGLWIARIMLTWGLVSAAMAFVQDATTFYVLRFLLGAAEAGFFPGIIYYLTQWFPARERGPRRGAVHDRHGHRRGDRRAALEPAAAARRHLGTARLAVAVPGRGAAGGAPGAGGLAPAQSAAGHRDLAARRRTALARRDARRRAGSRPDVHGTMRAAFASGRLWALAAIYFCIVLAFYGVSFWLPQILQQLGTASSATVALISALPYVAAAVAMVLVGSHSDATGERRWHVAGPALLGAIGFVMAATVPTSLVLSLAALSVAAMGVWGALGPFWALPTAFLTGRAAAGGVALVNSVGNIGGFVGPTLVGYVRDTTGGFAAGLWLLAAGLVIGAAIVALMPVAQRDSR